MNALDYYTNPEIVTFMKRETAYVCNPQDHAECEQEIFAELYDFMPLDVLGSKRIIKRVCERFKRNVQCIHDHEALMGNVDWIESIN